MTARRNKREVLLAGLHEIDLEVTLFGGQTFRWRRTGDDSADGWIGDRPVRVTVRADGLVVSPRNSVFAGLADAAHVYFDAGRDYGAIRAQLDRDGKLPVSAPGLRILRQPPFETAITFIASANNNIIRIGRTIAALCDMAGSEVAADGELRRAFPRPEQLAEVSVEQLRRDANLGYRDEYVFNAARMVAAGEIDLAALDGLTNEALRTELCRLPGVGPKVADCIALFGYGRMDVFPVDTWVRKAYSALYLGDDERVTDRVIGELARARFGEYAGLAQQYLFEAARRGERTQSRAR